MHAFSQRFGFRVGANFSNMIGKNDIVGTYSDDYKTALGGHLGFVQEIPVNKDIVVQTGFTIAQRGYKVDKTNYKSNTYLFYMDIPINALYKLDLNAVKLFAGAGPNIAVGVFGIHNWTITSPLASVTDDKEIVWGKEDDSDLRRLDIGLNLTAGIEYGVIQLGVTYTPSFSNIAPTRDHGAFVKNKLFAVSMAFVFGK
ncbi:MAG: hypothetical protein A2275_00070 [Bacteroidetes bacterium RIFOXYA12_FULL_35_11]|nr:MAG: hypothetical protein A2X01_06780 [Bacteroidetes bacterium GWF2_35_48]OFY81145.1 MAG: hypothetical protein A2275_00070 [Bacteroidetes bacterium RIFOXYA12_FULL_35_11]OFY98944.1 MAG: hypothetical protein A2491_12335 [Bacteroidetes bacterium RIFOXYC12_FULL_35_7]